MRSLAAAIVVGMVWCAGAWAEVVIETVIVGHPGNAGELSGAGAGGYGPDGICGAVDYWYRMGKYEVTNAQYCEFLNAVAATDPNGLYDTRMAGGYMDTGGIVRSVTPEGYTYAVREGRGANPVNNVDFYDALRFANWMHNGQPTGGQTAETTEDGAYTLSLGAAVQRNPGARVFLPTEDEWYKAAYYQGGPNGGYWDYATQSDVAPASEPPPGSGMPNGSANYFGPGGYAVGEHHIADVGAYVYSAGPYGTYDQNGNVWEWNETDIFGDGTRRGLRGGAWECYYFYLAASYRNENGRPDETGATTGFRLAAPVDEPIPATSESGLVVMSLLLLGAAVYLLHRR
jgi:formylglycine-generating enzyme required for sulfatase activity